MNPQPMNTPPTRRRRLPLAILLGFTAIACAWIVNGFAPAASRDAESAALVAPADAEPLPVAAVAAGPEVPSVPDVVLARAALSALDADNELRGATFIVSVVDRVAVLGGPVAHVRQSKRAEEIIRRVPGIADVRNSCFVSIGPDPLLNAVADRFMSSLPPRPVMFELPGVITGTVGPSFPSSGNANLNSAVASANPSNVVIARKPSAEASVLGGPVGPATRGTTVLKDVPPAVPAIAPGTLTANRGEVMAGVDAVRKSQARFAKLTAEFRDGILVIGGSAPLAVDAWDFAEKLRTVPGVARVAVGSVTAK